MLNYLFDITNKRSHSFNNKDLPAKLTFMYNLIESRKIDC